VTTELNDFATACAKVLILALWIALFGAWIETHAGHPVMAKATAVEDNK
jgi:hypothetical protein